MRKTSFIAGFLLASMAVSALPLALFAQSAQEYEAKLRAEEAKLQAEVDALSKDVNRLQGQKTTIEQAIALIDAQIREAQAKIRLRTLAIEGLTKDIKVKTNTVAELEGRLVRSRESLSHLVSRTNQSDSTSLPEIVLASGRMSDFFVQVDAYQTLKDSLGSMMEDVREYKSQTEEERAALEDRKIRETDARKAIETEKKLVEAKKAEQAELLAIKAGELKTYQQYVAEKQARISQIRSALFDLRGTDGIPFGDAYDYALEASSATGVRPALILAVLTQESDLGKNVGSCLVQDLSTGNGIGKNSGTLFERIMYSATDTKRPSDTVPFAAIASRLGKDWRSTPVSCPPGAKYYVGRGFGGGMGPSQFIPSTWELYKKEIGAAAGVSADQADPWNPHHAITATAIYLKKLGAHKGGYTAERNAACLYYSGRTCDSRAPANSFYGNQVVAKADSIQTNMINPILGR